LEYIPRWLLLQILALSLMQGRTVSYSSSLYSLQLPDDSPAHCGSKGTIKQGGNIRWVLVTATATWFRTFLFCKNFWGKDSAKKSAQKVTEK
jgi:hypothetical protein